MTWRLFIDPGHGGVAAPGAVSGVDFAISDYLHSVESHLALDIGLRVKRSLSRYPQFVLAMSRISDVSVPVEDRAKAANDFKADYYISLHFNGVTLVTARGIEVFAYPGSVVGEKLAQNVYRYSTSLTPWADRGVKFRSDLVVLNATNMPAIIFEGGFLTNTEEERLIASEAYRSALAEAVVHGICDTVGVTYQIPVPAGVYDSSAEVVRLSEINDKLVAENDALSSENLSLAVNNTDLRARLFEAEKAVTEANSQAAFLDEANLELLAETADLKSELSRINVAIDAIRLALEGV